MTDFIDIVMEARKKKAKIKEEPVDEEEDADELPEDDGAPEDMVDPEDNSPESEVGETDELPEDDGEPEDLTEEDDTDDTVESETEETDDLPDDDGEPEDLALDDDSDVPPEEGTGDDLPPEDGDPEDLSIEEDTGDEGEVSPDEGETTPDETVEETPEEDNPRSRRLLQEDFTILYFKTKDFLSKLTTLDKSDVILNQVVTQIDKNLSRLRTILWDFIVYDFDKNDMVTNLYRYNEFIEVFKVNLDMLSKGKDFVLKTRDELAKQSKNKTNIQ